MYYFTRSFSMSKQTTTNMFIRITHIPTNTEAVATVKQSYLPKALRNHFDIYAVYAEYYIKNYALRPSYGLLWNRIIWTSLNRNFAKVCKKEGFLVHGSLCSSSDLLEVSRMFHMQFNKCLEEGDKQYITQIEKCLEHARGGGPRNQVGFLRTVEQLLATISETLAKDINWSWEGLSWASFDIHVKLGESGTYIPIEQFYGDTAKKIKSSLISLPDPTLYKDSGCITAKKQVHNYIKNYCYQS